MLMRTFAEYTAWVNYAATEFATAEVAEERAQAHLKRLEAAGMVLLSGPKTKVTEIRAQLQGAPEIDRAAQDLLNAYATRKMTQVIMENCQRCANLVSREITRRTGGLEATQRRQMRWGP